MNGVRCKKCGTLAAAGEVRYVSSSEFLCHECFLGHAGKGRKTAATHAPRKDYDVSPVSKVQLVCDGCGFITKSPSDAPAVTCSYCGSKELTQQKSAAATLLAEADDSFDTYE